jgi:xylulokinase
MFQAKVVTINTQEGAAYGVALLAATATGEFKSVEEACKAAISITDTRNPVRKTATLYDRRYAVYTGLYRDLRARFGEIGALGGAD